MTMLEKTEAFKQMTYFQSCTCLEPMDAISRDDVGRLALEHWRQNWPQLPDEFCDPLYEDRHDVRQWPTDWVCESCHSRNRYFRMACRTCLLAGTIKCHWGNCKMFLVRSDFVYHLYDKHLLSTMQERQHDHFRCRWNNCNYFSQRFNHLESHIALHFKLPILLCSRCPPHYFLREKDHNTAAKFTEDHHSQVIRPRQVDHRHRPYRHPRTSSTPLLIHTLLNNPGAKGTSATAAAVVADRLSLPTSPMDLTSQSTDSSDDDKPTKKPSNNLQEDDDEIIIIGTTSHVENKSSTDVQSRTKPAVASVTSSEPSQSNVDDEDLSPWDTVTRKYMPLLKPGMRKKRRKMNRSSDFSYTRANEAIEPAVMDMNVPKQHERVLEQERTANHGPLVWSKFVETTAVKRPIAQYATNSHVKTADQSLQKPFLSISSLQFHSQTLPPPPPPLADTTSLPGLSTIARSLKDSNSVSHFYDLVRLPPLNLSASQQSTVLSQQPLENATTDLNLSFRNRLLPPLTEVLLHNNRESFPIKVTMDA